jgi:outer membrane protein assembly factor BamB
MLIAHFDDAGYLLLDADTGKREAAWPHGTRDHDIKSADPLLTGQDVSNGSDKLRGVDLDGKTRWTFEPGRCAGIQAGATADTAVAFLDFNCGNRHSELTALDLKTGRKLWNRPANWFGTAPALVIGGLIVGLEADGRSGTLVGIEPRTGAVKWRFQQPSGWGCDTKLKPAGDVVILLNCPTAATEATQTVITAIDTKTGGTVWQRTAPFGRNTRTAVTTDARVVSLRDATDGCRLDVTDDSGYREVRLPKLILCGFGVAAMGTQVLTAGDGAIIALH